MSTYNNKLGVGVTGGVPETLEENIAAIAKAGFDCSFLDWNGNKEKFLTEASLMKKYGLGIDYVHAPFGGLNCIWDESRDGEMYFNKLMRCVADIAEVGVDKAVIHCTAGAPEPHGTVTGLERFRKLIEYSVSLGVRPCFENLEYPEMLGLIMSEFAAEYDLGFCYDTGHEATCTPGMRFIPLYGDRLAVTHIHDNYGASYTKVPIIHGDCHMLPLDGALDFKRIMRDIRSTGYTGALCIEAGIRKDLGTYYGFNARMYYERAYAALCEIASY